MDLYTDGYTIGYNPSRIGGTWAFVLVERGRVVEQVTGVVVPDDVDTRGVTNNQVELLAVLKGLEFAREQGYKIGTVYSDSQITLGRVFQNWSLKNIPTWMVEMLRRVKPSPWTVRGEWVKGHNGNKYNELCDHLCEEQASIYEQERELLIALK
jgi:ribonuclease HI